MDTRSQLICTVCLGVCAVLCCAGVLAIAAVGREVPPALSAMAGTTVGALTALLTPSRSPSTNRDGG